MQKLFCGIFLLTLLCACADRGAPADNSRALRLGDGSEISHAWDEAGPLPAENDWVKVEVAGYLLSEDKAGDGFSWTWTFTLDMNNPGVNLVAISDVSDATASRLVAPGDGVFSKGKWLAQSAARPVSGFHLPWLYKDGDSVRIMRFSLADIHGETRILYQPIFFSHSSKKSLLSIAGASTAGTGI